MADNLKVNPANIDLTTTGNRTILDSWYGSQRGAPARLLYVTLDGNPGLSGTLTLLLEAVRGGGAGKALWQWNGVASTPVSQTFIFSDESAPQPGLFFTSSGTGWNAGSVLIVGYA